MEMRVWMRRNGSAAQDGGLGACLYWVPVTLWDLQRQSHVMGEDAEGEKAAH